MKIFDLDYLLHQTTQLLTIVPRFVPEVVQQPAIRNPIAVSFGAVAGALTRYYLSLWFAQKFGSSFPYGTFFINVTGCFVMGFLFTIGSERLVALSPEVRLLLAIGFLGSYTTFSTYGLDTVNLLLSHRLSSAIFYAAGSALLGILSIYLGMLFARFIK